MSGTGFFGGGHDFIVWYVVHMHAGCLTLADTVQYNKGDV